MDCIESFSKEIIGLINSREITSRKQLNEKKIELCKKYSLHSLPSNPTILSFAGKSTGTLKALLSIKPTRSLSGITVVAVMPPPSECPGKCIYCPNSLLDGKATPKSYTGREPATMRALRLDFDAKKQVLNRLQQLQATGHETTKIELVVMGGTFLAQDFPYQKKFMLGCFNAVAGTNSSAIEEAKKAAEHSAVRITGLTFETRPDFCGQEEINRMRYFAGTRCELGVQTIRDSVYRRVNRNHSVKEVVDATRLLKDSGFKVTYHYMPGLPGVSSAKDLRDLREIFSNPCFRPDSLKIYPCLVIPGTELFRQWKEGQFKPISTDEAADLVLKAKEFVPRWVRIMRIQRDIPSTVVAAGVKATNLRQILHEKMRQQGIKCNCIRCREAGLSSMRKKIDFKDTVLFAESYDASKGKEFFISLEDNARDTLFGFVRLRIPFKPFRPEIGHDTAIVRELRVFGKPLPLGKKKALEIQHRGFGKMLLQEAEKIAADDFDSRTLAVTSGIGVKQYYRKLGFFDCNDYVLKTLR